MACLKRLMKLYAMIIKESHASVAQKSWEENLSAEFLHFHVSFHQETIVICIFPAL